MAILKGVMGSSLGNYKREYLEKCLEIYTDEAKKHIRGLLLSCAYQIAEVSNKRDKEYIILDETDLDGNFISREWVFPEYVDFKEEVLQ